MERTLSPISATAMRWLTVSLGVAALWMVGGCSDGRALDKPASIPLATAPTETKALPERTLKIRLTGNIRPDAPHSVSVADLEALPQTEYAVHDPYLKRKVVYRGALLREFVAKYGHANTKRVRFRALDDYKADLSREEWTRWEVLLATRKDGVLTPVSDNGPARIVFPYDTTPEIKPTLYDDRWIWQIVSAEFSK